jgi:hypothetical protein
VFDLDHTIGYFKQFVQILNHMDIDKIHDSYFNMFDLFPEYFRPNIFHLFEYLILKRKERKINSIILYTNNNNDIFINKVIEYINHKIGDKLFDIIITTTHPLRTNKYKDYSELIICGNLDSDTNICFIDDKKHVNMICKNVFYVRCEPYAFNINVNEIYNRCNVKLLNDKSKYMLNLNNQKRVTEQLFKRIQCFITSKTIIQT